MAVRDHGSRAGTGDVEARHGGPGLPDPPAPPAASAPAAPGPDETVNRLAGNWRIFQLRRGHRFATDDVLTAWTAVRARPGALRLLDLGAGTGSVGLMALLCMPADARLTSVELQARSVSLIRKTLAYNGITSRVNVRAGDLRDPDMFRPGETFDLVAANPPYLVPGTVRRSPYDHRALARLELNGDIFDYCRTAATVLAPDGAFCFCHHARDPRPEAAIRDAGMTLRSRQDVIFRDGHEPLLALFCCARQGERCDLPPIVVRDADGARTAAYREVRVAMRIEAP